MLVLKFKHRGYKKEVEIESENFRGIYYDLSVLLNPSLSTFEEEQYIMTKIFICICQKKQKMRH